jgi:DNA-binding response OmpR family regulator
VDNKNTGADTNSDNLQTILVIDDDPDWTELLRRYYFDRYQVEVANTATEAIEIARKERPVLIIVDLVMPLIDGFGVMRRLEEASNHRIPTILLTGWKSAEVEECANSLGCIAVLGKPVMLDELDATILSAIN